MSTSQGPNSGPNSGATGAGRISTDSDPISVHTTHSETHVEHAPNTEHTGGVQAGSTAPQQRLGLDRDAVVQREKDEHGGIKWGSAFFGWLTATGTAVLLTALLAAAGTAVGLANNTAAGEAVSQATSNASTIGIAGGIALLVILFLAYYCGGYVAGRMARFNGTKQGVAVWVWAVVIAIVVAALTAVAGDKYNVLSQLNAFPRIPVSEGDLSTGAIIAVIAAALASLLGAVLGGKAGMHFHRKVDRTGLGR